MKIDKMMRMNGDPVPPRVIKFGGTSVTGGDRIDTIADVACDRLEGFRPVIVVSAFAQVTTLLERAALAARSGEHDQTLARLRTIHEDAVRSMTDSAATLCATVDDLLAECSGQLDLIASAEECSSETLDEILSFGERLSSSIITRGLVGRGVAACAIDAADLVVTDANFGDARADMEATRRRMDTALPVLPVVPIVTGFIGATPGGKRTTLGREGSDYSAAVLAWGLRAETVEIWTDVDGIMSADPHVVAAARPLRDLTYDELLELTSWGAKVVHPKTVRPLRDLGIELTVRNTLSPKDAGTRVGPVGRRRERHGPFGVACIDSVAFLASDGEEEQLEVLAKLKELGGRCCAVTAVGKRPLEGDCDRLPKVLASEGVTVHEVVEGASGRSISYLVRPEDGDVAVRAVHKALFEDGVSGDERQPPPVHRSEADAVSA